VYELAVELQRLMKQTQRGSEGHHSHTYYINLR
jgi:hypothetical protein